MRSQASFAVALVIASVTLGVGDAAAAPETVLPARDFVDSVGVCTHWGYSDTPYGAKADQVAQLLYDSGIRHVRDGIHPKLYDLADHGVHATALVDLYLTGSTMADFIRDLHDFQAAHTPPPLDSLEGPNEPEGFWPKLHPQGYLGQGFPAGAIQFQKDLYAGAKTDALLENLTIFGIALGTTLTPSHPDNPLGNAGEMSAYVDWGNFHPYPGGNAFNDPKPYDTIAKYYWDSTFPSLPLEGFGTEVQPWFPYYAAPYSPKPMGATETGYSTHTNGESERVVGKYLPRLFFEFFRKGVRRTFAYEFLDEFVNPTDREANFGMVHHDLTPKPSYRAMSSILHLLGGDESSEGPSLLDIDLVVTAVTVPANTVRAGASGDPVTYDRTSYVRHVVLGKGDGRRFVVLWHDISCADHSVTPAVELTPPPIPTTLTVHGVFDHAIIHELDDDGNASERAMAASGPIALAVPDRILVVELVPAGGSGPDGGALDGAVPAQRDGGGHAGAASSADGSSGAGGGTTVGGASGSTGGSSLDASSPAEGGVATPSANGDSSCDCRLSSSSTAPQRVTVFVLLVALGFVARRTTHSRRSG